MFGDNSDRTEKNLFLNPDKPPELCFDESVSGVCRTLPDACAANDSVNIARVSPVYGSYLLSNPIPRAFNKAYANVVLPSLPVPYEISIYYADVDLSNSLPKI